MGFFSKLFGREIKGGASQNPAQRVEQLVDTLREMEPISKWDYPAVEARRAIAEKLVDCGADAVEPLLEIIRDRELDEPHALAAEVLGKIGDRRPSRS